MSEIAVILLVLAALAFASYVVYVHREQTNDLLALERQRTLEWWKRSQAHIDNLQDRVMSKEFETYAQATYVERPSDQPQFTADGELTEDGMATDLLEVLRRNRQDSGYDVEQPDIAEDWASGPIVG